jgi:uncharacterized protein YdaU (DUF1376 family)
VRTLLGALLRQGEALKDAFYFPHDYNATRDPKIVKLIRTLGYEGYGLYWALIERLYENGGRVSEDYEQLAYELRTEAGKVKAVISGFALFAVADGMIGSCSIDRRLEERRNRSEAARDSANARWMRPHSDGNAKAMLERKKERKEREGDSANHSKRRCASKEGCTTTPMPGETFCSFHQATELIA